jgi:purine-nucleoside/S-methyl-5'-thioadenosine phosphorylase / adenosine deaminase
MVYDRAMEQTLRAATVPALEKVPGLVHGFEQRLGPPGWETRDGSRRRVAHALAPSGRLLLLHQVHGVKIHRAPWDGQPDGDAATADRPKLILGIETADCLPVLLVDARRRVVAAAHAGWRGTAAGIARKALDALIADGSRAGDIIAALGPGIGPCCYEVGPELVPEFGRGGESFFRPGKGDRLLLDVRAANAHQLREGGVPEAQIHSVAECTFHEADRYHSYRREGAGGGRMISYIGFAE